MLKRPIELRHEASAEQAMAVTQRMYADAVRMRSAAALQRQHMCSQLERLSRRSPVFKHLLMIYSDGYFDSADEGSTILRKALEASIEITHGIWGTFRFSTPLRAHCV